MPATGIRRAGARFARGRLRPGDRVPGTRTLVETLGVHRSTVVAAYAELASQGWVGTRRGGATFVVTASPDIKPLRFARGAQPESVSAVTGFALEPPPPSGITQPQPERGGLSLWGGTPDLRLLPVDLLARAYRRVTKRRGRSLLGYSADSLGTQSCAPWWLGWSPPRAACTQIARP